MNNCETLNKIKELKNLFKKQYFNEIKVGDKVWDFNEGWGEAIKIHVHWIAVHYIKKNLIIYYDYDGKDLSYGKGRYPQSLFWDEIKFEVPTKPKVMIKKNKIIYAERVDFINEDTEFLLNSWSFVKPNNNAKIKCKGKGNVKVTIEWEEEE